MRYEVNLINSSGEKEKKQISADSEQNLFEIIQKEGSYLVSFKEVFKSESSKGKIDIKLTSIFCYQLSTMLESGVELNTALNLLQSKAKKEKERNIYRRLLESVQKGNSLSSSMEMMDGVFDSLLINMVKSGEVGGHLEGVLKTMSQHYDKNIKTKQKIKAATLYPIILAIVSFVIVMVLVLFVLPQITSTFPAEELPTTTRILYAISNFILSYWWLVIIVIGGIVVLLKVLYDTPRIRIQWHQKILYIPFIGNLLRTIYSARLARSFSSLYSHGVSTLEMIDLSSTTLNNSYFEKRLQEMLLEVSHGLSISESLENIEEFDPMLSSMMKIGEETGHLDDVLVKIANYFDGESEAAITKIVAIIEPVMIVIMGITIAFIILSIMQPMFKMYDYV